jgi:fibronectin type 3 domain-containing protein
MKYKTLLIMPLLYLAIVNGATGQDTAQINVRSRIQKNAVLLRWAASSPVAWKHTNRYGFNIERYTIVRDDSILSESKKKILNQIPVKARPLHEWETPVQNSDYAAVIAQALYGEDFELSGGDAQGIARIINLSQELEQRFAMSLYAADQDFEAACMAGWGWRDNTVKQGERYLYRIVPVMPDNSSLNIEQGAGFVAMDEYEELPKPIGLTAVFGDKSVMLAWNYNMLGNIYNSYLIEKSADGRSFKKVGGIPVTNLNNRDERIYFVDSLIDNTAKCYYRICGITPFGEIGPPSDSITGKGVRLLSYSPNISKVKMNSRGEMEIEWEFDEHGNDLVKSFELSRSDFPDKHYTTVLRNIEPAKRSLLFKELNPTNYFVITAIPYEGEPRKSFPVLVQPADSVPPAIPSNLQGKIDSAGTVTIWWNKNIEADLLGYKVYRSFLKGDELVPLFDIALKDTIYKDTVDINSLNRKVYYTLSSVDLRYNQSDFAPLLELEKPDIIPPASPMISGYKVREDGIEIQWINSSDANVTQHRVWRHEKGTEYMSETLLKSIDNMSVTNYVDTSATTGVQYVYTVTALKNNWLESLPSNELTAFTGFSKQQNMELDYFNAIVDRQNKMLKLEWNDKLPDVQYYELYKSENGENMSLWKELQSDQHEIIDSNISINTTYRYLIRAILKDGKNTKSKSVNIKY